MAAVWVKVERVLQLANPLQTWCWEGERPDGAASNCLSNRSLMDQAAPIPIPVSDWRIGRGNLASHELGLAHVGRVKHLITAGWTDAIEVDVGIPVLGYWGPAWAVVDGNHRLAAAALRGTTGFWSTWLASSIMLGRF